MTDENTKYWDSLEVAEDTLLGYCAEDDRAFEAFQLLIEHKRELERRLGLEESND